MVMKVNKLKRGSPDYPDVLDQIPSPPKEIFYLGTPPKDWLSRPRVAIVGSRKISHYGRAVTTKLATELAQSGVIIISGLAYGVDAAAHQACLDAGGMTVAVLAGGLDKIHPTSHTNLARQILIKGGT